MSELPPTGCPFRWHMLPCALSYGHGSPHHMVAEQPRLDAIEAEAKAQERERLRADQRFSPDDLTHALARVKAGDRDEAIIHAAAFLWHGLMTEP